MTDIILPELGEGIDRAVVAHWHYAIGDHVEADDDIVEVATDKAIFNIPAGVSGRLKEICVPMGQEVCVGRALARLDNA